MYIELLFTKTPHTSSNCRQEHFQHGELREDHLVLDNRRHIDCIKEDNIYIACTLNLCVPLDMHTYVQVVSVYILCDQPLFPMRSVDRLQYPHVREKWNGIRTGAMIILCVCVICYACIPLLFSAAKPKIAPLPRHIASLIASVGFHGSWTAVPSLTRPRTVDKPSFLQFCALSWLLEHGITIVSVVVPWVPLLHAAILIIKAAERHFFFFSRCSHGSAAGFICPSKALEKCGRAGKHYLFEVTYAHVAGAFLEVTNEMLL